MPDETPITEKLLAWRDGDQTARDELFSLVHAELYQMSQRALRAERRSHTLNPTAMVNELYIRVARLENISLENRRPFFVMAAKIMRHVLVDHARANNAHKRRGFQERVDLELVEAVDARTSIDVLALDEVLSKLQESDPLLVQIIELKFFSGFSEEDIAQALGVSRSTIQREWRVGKRLLAEMLGGKKR